MKLKDFFARSIGSSGIVSLDKNLTVKVIGQFGGYLPNEDSRNPCFNRFMSFARESKMFFDIGAHVGLYTLTAASLMPRGGSVHAFEASSTSVRVLRKHLRMNKISCCRVNGVFVGDSLDVVTFYQGPLTTGSRSGLLKPKSFSSFEPVRAQSITLDRYCERHQVYPDLVKIDVEGAELKVLQGARSMLLATRPKIIVSLHLEQMRELGHSIEELSQLIDTCGYEASDAHGERVTQFSSTEYILTPRLPRGQ